MPPTPSFSSSWNGPTRRAGVSAGMGQFGSRRADGNAGPGAESIPRRCACNPRLRSCNVVQKSACAAVGSVVPTAGGTAIRRVAKRSDAASASFALTSNVTGGGLHRGLRLRRGPAYRAKPGDLPGDDSAASIASSRFDSSIRKSTFMKGSGPMSHHCSLPLRIDEERAVQRAVLEVVEAALGFEGRQAD